MQQQKQMWASPVLTIKNSVNLELGSSATADAAILQQTEHPCILDYLVRQTDANITYMVHCLSIFQNGLNKYRLK